MEIILKEVEVTKLNLQPGDVLTVTVKTDSYGEDNLSSFKDGLKKFFPNNPIAIIALSSNDEVLFSVTSQPQSNYCTDCNCGKKEQAESQ